MGFGPNSARQVIESPYHGQSDPDSPGRWQRLQDKLQQGREIQRGAIDDWRNRFRDEYLNQMQHGAQVAGGNIKADAGMMGYSGALARGAEQRSGELQQSTRANMVALGNQMSMADSLANYQMAGRRSTEDLSMHEMYTNAKLAQEAKEKAESDEAWEHEKEAGGATGRTV